MLALVLLKGLASALLLPGPDSQSPCCSGVFGVKHCRLRPQSQSQRGQPTAELRVGEAEVLEPRLADTPLAASRYAHNAESNGLLCALAIWLRCSAMGGNFSRHQLSPGLGIVRGKGQ